MGTAERNRLLAGAGLLALLAGLWIAVSSGFDDGEPATAIPAETTARPAAGRPPPPPATARRRTAPFVRLVAVGAYDPEGDGRERDEEAGLAVDGRPDTAWRTERYSRWFKEGVGLVLDAGRSVRVERVVVDSPTPGGRAEIRLGTSPEGPFTLAAPARSLTARTSFPVSRRPGRYVLVWVVEVPDGSATEISEVRLRARG
jgi:putative peptidoglycan lipid II flippase